MRKFYRLSVCKSTSEVKDFDQISSEIHFNLSLLPMELKLYKIPAGDIIYNFHKTLQISA
jgi:hypothetical protein